jgi:hypothetical protein
LQEGADRERREREGELALSSYREPLTAAAFDLQSRLYNILEQGFLDAYGDPGNERAEEAVKSTLFKFAQYFGWREILRQEIHFMRFTEDAETRAVGVLLTELEETFNRDDYAREFMLWRDEQRALGELMIVQDAVPRTCLGHWNFFELYNTNPYISRWFARLERHLRDGTASNDRRLALVQSALRRLVIQLDPRELQYKHSSMKDATQVLP